MIKAELDYNPYLMEINVVFNGQPPRINSLIEKYQSKPLQDWISLLPQIFHDEMNGYYFELDFSGTELDCEEVNRAFRKANVSSQEVAVFLKNKLDSRENKLKSISELLEWLDNNPNRKFDVERFRYINHELFDENYTYLMIHGELDNTEIKDVSIENISTIRELECTDITHTPILYYISEDVLMEMTHELPYLLSRRDFSTNQLFFYIADSLDQDKIKRVIIDLGISEPEVVSGFFDDRIHKYSLLYPISDYISDSIKAFRNAANKISAILEEENKKSELEGKEIHSHLDVIENNISRIKAADEKIQSRDNMDIPLEFKELKEGCLAAVIRWRNKKTKITKPEEAFAAATEFDSFIKTLYSDFYAQLNEITMARAEEIRNMYLLWYQDVKLDETFSDTIDFSLSDSFQQIPDQLYELLKLKEEEYVVPSSSPFGSLFKSKSEEDNQPVLVTTYYYQVWREFIVAVITPKIDEITTAYFEQLKIYSNSLADIYHDHLSQLLSAQTKEKNEVSSQLSEDEKLLQIDNDWLTAFEDQIKNIERS